MPFLGFIIMAVLFGWLFVIGGKKSNEQTSSTLLHSVNYKGDLLNRFLDLVQDGCPLNSMKITKDKWPIFSAALFLFLRNENVKSSRSRVSITEFMSYLEANFSKEDLYELAHIATSKRLLDFDGETVDLKDTPNLEVLLNELFR